MRVAHIGKFNNQQMGVIEDTKHTSEWNDTTSTKVN